MSMEKWIHELQKAERRRGVRKHVPRSAEWVALEDLIRSQGRKGAWKSCGWDRWDRLGHVRLGSEDMSVSKTKKSKVLASMASLDWKTLFCG